MEEMLWRLFAQVLPEELQKEFPGVKVYSVANLWGMRNFYLSYCGSEQKVREAGGDNYSYANSYEIITRLKQFADSYGIYILLVHHTRKQGSDDKFDMIPGTTGLLGAGIVPGNQ